MASPSVDTVFAAAVRGVREARGLSQEQLAREMNRRGHPSFQQTTVNKIEAGSRRVSIAEAAALAAALDASIAQLIDPAASAEAARAFALEGEARVFVLSVLDYSKAFWAAHAARDTIRLLLEQSGDPALQKRYRPILEWSEFDTDFVKAWSALVKSSDFKQLLEGLGFDVDEFMLG